MITWRVFLHVFLSFKAVFYKGYDTRKTGRYLEAFKVIHGEHGPSNTGVVDWAPELDDEKKISNDSLRKNLESMRRKDPFFDLTLKKSLSHSIFASNFSNIESILYIKYIDDILQRSLVRYSWIPWPLVQFGQTSADLVVREALRCYVWLLSSGW